MPLETQLFLKQQELNKVAQRLKHEHTARRKLERERQQERVRLAQELQTLEQLILTDPLRAVDAVRKMLANE